MDFQKLEEVTGVIVRNLNKIIDINYYPVPEARKSNMRHRWVVLDFIFKIAAIRKVTALVEKFLFGLVSNVVLQVSFFLMGGGRGG